MASFTTSEANVMKILWEHVSFRIKGRVVSGSIRAWYSGQMMPGSFPWCGYRLGIEIMHPVVDLFRSQT